MIKLKHLTWSMGKHGIIQISIPCKLNNPPGTVNLCFVFKGDTEEKPYLDYFTFTPYSKDIVTPNTHWDFCNSAQGWRTLKDEDME
jgi:hypothetical protein